MSALASPLLLLGWDFRQTPVEVREKIAFSPERLAAGLAQLRERGLLGEGAILSTCNRTEIYGLAGRALSSADPFGALTAFLAEFHGVPEGDFAFSAYRRQGAEAARHLFRVASGLESLALGEDQIIGQVREALRLSTGAGTVKSVLHRLFQKSLEAGKRVRSETGLGSRPISIPGVAIELAQKLYEDLTPRSFLLLGAGETAGIFYDLLVARNATRITVANRTLARAEGLVRRGGRAVAWEDLELHLPQADFLVSAVSSTEPVITAEMARRALHLRRGKPLFFLDLGIPRNVHPAVGDLDGAFLYAVDDLQGIAERNRQERQKEIAPAEAVLEEELAAFMAWFGALEVVPTLTALRQKFEALKESEFDQALAKLDHLSEKDREKLRLMAQSLVRALLRHPTEALKEEPDPARRLERAEAVRHLFELEP